MKVFTAKAIEVELRESRIWGYDVLKSSMILIAVVLQIKGYPSDTLFSQEAGAKPPSEATSSGVVL